MSRIRTRLRLAVVAAAGAVALSSCGFSAYDLPLPGGADLGQDPMTVTVEFRDVLDLVPQSAVKVDDVSVGRVDAVELDGYAARVTLLVRQDVDLPDNALAAIRQTSLLGEKFVDLSAPETGATDDRLGDGDLIPLERTGRNPEIEEVFGALSLVLNGGGVAQLRTITQELNQALEGREGTVKSVLRRIDTFMGGLDAGRNDIVEAIEQLNQLAITANEQRGSIELALDELPDALASIDRQRDDLVRVLGALDELSNASVEVIRASKQGTVDSLRALDPVLTKLAEAGQSLPDSLSTLLTYPFVDEVVGRNPTAARNLHFGDYTNLSVKLDVDLRNGLPTLPGLPALPGLPDLPLGRTVNQLTDVQRCLLSGQPGGEVCESLRPRQLRALCADFPTSPLTAVLCPGSRPEQGGGAGGGGGLLGELPIIGDLLGLRAPQSSEGGASCLLPGLLCRVAPGGTTDAAGPGAPPRARGTSALTALLGQTIEGAQR